jgi:hypothetical protein
LSRAFRCPPRPQAGTLVPLMAHPCASYPEGAGGYVTELMPAAQPRCQAGRACHRAPCFQVRLEAAAGCRPVRTTTELCAEHLGDIHAMAVWAREQGLEGQLTVLAVDLLSAGEAPPAGGRNGLVFDTIPLHPTA